MNGQGIGGQGVPQGAPPGGIGGPGFLFGGPAISMILAVLVILTCVVLAVGFWRLCRNAGFNPALGLLMLCPVVNLGVVLYVAFAEWPVLREVQRLRAIALSAPPQQAVGTGSGSGGTP